MGVILGLGYTFEILGDFEKRCRAELLYNKGILLYLHNMLTYMMNCTSLGALMDRIRLIFQFAL